MKKKITFTTKDKEGKELKLDVLAPAGQVLQKAQIIYASVWQQSINHNPPLILRAKLDKVLREQGLWNDDKASQERKLLKEIRDKQLKLLKGGMKVDEGVNISLDIIKKRNELNSLLSERNRVDGNTAEAQADNAQFNYLVSQCTVYNSTGDNYFPSYEDYLNRLSEDAAKDAASKLMTLVYDLQENTDESRPENVFLKQVGRMNEKSELIKNGKKVDLEGHYINDEGRYVDENGNLIDEDNVRVDENGYPVVTDTKPFVDENGKPLEVKFGKK